MIYPDIPEEIKIILSKNYTDFYEIILQQKKLAFCKLLKDKSSLDLKTAKSYADVVFDYDAETFKQFDIVSQRKKKLDKIKIRLFSEELAKAIKSKSVDELSESFLEMAAVDLENFLAVINNEK